MSNDVSEPVPYQDYETGSNTNCNRKRLKTVLCCYGANGNPLLKRATVQSAFWLQLWDFLFHVTGFSNVKMNFSSAGGRMEMF